MDFRLRGKDEVLNLYLFFKIELPVNAASLPYIWESILFKPI